MCVDWLRSRLFIALACYKQITGQTDAEKQWAKINLF